MHILANLMFIVAKITLSISDKANYFANRCAILTEI